MRQRRDAVKPPTAARAAPARAASATPAVAQVLQLQQSAGNQATSVWLAREVDWAKLSADYEAAVTTPDWSRAGVLLNGMSEKDILERLRKLPVESAKAILAAAEVTMKDWPDRVPRLCRQVILEAPVPAGTPTPRVKAAGESGGPPPGKETNAKWVKFMSERDDKARQFGAADYDDYVQNMLVQGGSVVGLKASAKHPLHPLFLDRLETGSAKAEALMGTKDFGIRSISGQENRPGNHAWGIASDFDSDSNPYTINESGEEEHDKLLEPVYERIAQTMLGRPTVMTRSVEGKDKKATGLQGASYTSIAEEADAMAAYFSVLDVAESEDAKKRAKLPARRKLTAREFPPETLAKVDKSQAQADYDLLLSKKGAEAVGGDAVFTGGRPGSFRDPRRGFLSIRQEIVEGMRAAGLRWGGTDFGGECGDMMHFDDGNRHADYVAFGTKNPTAKRQAEG